MSVKKKKFKNKKHSDDEKKTSPGVAKEHGSGTKKFTNVVKSELSNKNVSSKLSKSQASPKDGMSKDVSIDKNSKLKDRKKFKRKKAMEKKKRKLEQNVGAKSDSKAETSQNVTEKTSGKAMKPHVKVSNKDGQQNKKSSLSVKKKEKRDKWKQKQMREKLTRLGKIGKLEETEDTVAKVHVPKTVKEATANWTKLQQTLSEKAPNSRKRKIPVDKIINPKLQRIEKEREDEVNQTEEPEIWFDDVDEILLDRKPASSQSLVNTEDNESSDDDTTEPETQNPLVKSGTFKGLTKIVCMDCEMVGVGTDGKDDMLARVSIVNQHGEPIYDKFVMPKEDVVDYRTYVSGVRPSDLKKGEKFEDVQKDVADILKGRILVGHSINNDLKVLYISHPKDRIRDTSKFKRFKQLTGGRTPSLKKLTDKLLGVQIQEGEHNSIQDAQATMRLYTTYMYNKEREDKILKKNRKRKNKKGKKKQKENT
ncbi:REX4 [Mactra antiquata]